MRGEVAVTFTTNRTERAAPGAELRGGDRTLVIASVAPAPRQVARPLRGRRRPHRSRGSARNRAHCAAARARGRARGRRVLGARAHRFARVVDPAGGDLGTVVGGRGEPGARPARARHAVHSSRSCSWCDTSTARWSSTCPTGCSTSDARRRVHDLPRVLRRTAARLAARARPRVGLLDVRVHDPREFTTDRHRSVDDTPFGGGAGMVMMPEPLFAAVEASGAPRPLLLLSAAGPRFDQARARELARGCRGSHSSAGATRASTSGLPITCATASCRSATTCSPAVRRPPSW